MPPPHAAGNVGSGKQRAPCLGDFLAVSDLEGRP